MQLRALRVITRLFKDALNDISMVCLFLHPGVFPGGGGSPYTRYTRDCHDNRTVAELERHKTNMNTKEKHP